LSKERGDRESRPQGRAEKALGESSSSQLCQALTEDDIKTLVVDEKNGCGHSATAVQGELDRVSQTLTGRIRQLAERYATPLPQPLLLK